jgi:hypothetical protein
METVDDILTFSALASAARARDAQHAAISLHSWMPAEVLRDAKNRERSALVEEDTDGRKSATGERRAILERSRRAQGDAVSIPCLRLLKMASKRRDFAYFLSDSTLMQFFVALVRLSLVRRALFPRG